MAWILQVLLFMIYPVLSLLSFLIPSLLPIMVWAIPSFVLPEFPPVPPGFRIGMEIEMGEQALAHLANDFDFEEMQTKYPEKLNGMPDEFFDDYLENSAETFDKLPAQLKAFLSQGFELESLIIRPDIKSSKPKSIDSQKSLDLPKQILNVHGKPFQPESTSIQLPPRTKWQMVYDRWRALPRATKASAITWELLSSNKKAYLMIYALRKVIQPKQNLPKHILDLYNRLNWILDNDALEFRHRDAYVVSDPREFYKDVVTLARRAGIERNILFPNESFLAQSARDEVILSRLTEKDKKKYLEQRNQWHALSFHYHVSIEGKDLYEQGILLNYLALVRRLKMGILNDLTGKGDFLYNEMLHSRGLVRLVSPTRMEFRFHNIPLREELIFNIQALTLPLDQALVLIEQEIARHIDNQVVDKLMKYGSKQVTGLVPFFPKEAKARLTPYFGKLSEIYSIQNRLRNNEHISQSDAQSVLAVLQAHDNHLKEELISSMLGSSIGLPDPLRERLPELIDLNDQHVDDLIKREFDRTQVWTVEMWSQFLVLFERNEMNPQFNINMLKFTLKSQKEWTPQVRDYLTDLVKPTTSLRTLDLIYQAAKMQTSNWPSKMWSQTLALLRTSKERVILAFCAVAIAEQPMWPAEAWAEVDRQLQNPANREFILRQLLNGILHQPKGNLTLLPTITKLSSNPDPIIQMRAKLILDNWKKQNDFSTESVNEFSNLHPECRTLF